MRALRLPVFQRRDGQLEGGYLIYAPPLLDAFVKESTDFATWDEMVRSATGLRYRR